MTRKTKRILLVDDEVEILKLLAYFLRTLGYGICEARNAKQGIEVMNTEIVDLALIDLKLPGMDGIGLTRAIRKTEPSLPVIVYSGNRFVDVASEALKAGANEYIEKPFTLIKIKRTIERFLKEQK